MLFGNVEEPEPERSKHKQRRRVSRSRFTLKDCAMFGQGFIKDSLPHGNPHLLTSGDESRVETALKMAQSRPSKMTAGQLQRLASLMDGQADIQDISAEQFELTEMPESASDRLTRIAAAGGLGELFSTSWIGQGPKRSVLDLPRPRSKPVLHSLRQSEQNQDSETQAAISASRLQVAVSIPQVRNSEVDMGGRQHSAMPIPALLPFWKRGSLVTLQEELPHVVQLEEDLSLLDTSSQAAPNNYDTKQTEDSSSGEDSDDERWRRAREKSALERSLQRVSHLRPRSQTVVNPMFAMFAGNAAPLPLHGGPSPPQLYAVEEHTPPTRVHFKTSAVVNASEVSDTLSKRTAPSLTVLSTVSDSPPALGNATTSSIFFAESQHGPRPVLSEAVQVELIQVCFGQCPVIEITGVMPR
jgi:hypothetical protein